MSLQVHLARLGRDINTLSRTFLINKAMDVTKSDPNAAPGKYDFLKEIGQLIYRTALLPTTHKGLVATLWNIFDGSLSVSRRAHAHERDNRLWDTSKDIMSLASFIRQGIISTDIDKKKLKHKKSIKERLSFNKEEEEIEEV